MLMTHSNQYITSWTCTHYCRQNIVKKVQVLVCSDLLIKGAFDSTHSKVTSFKLTIILTTVFHVNLGEPELCFLPPAISEENLCGRVSQVIYDLQSLNL